MAKTSAKHYLAEIPDRRAVVDRRALDDALWKAADEHGAGAAATRQAALAALKDALLRGREETARRLLAGAPGLQVMAANCFLVDQILRCLFDFATGAIYRASNPTAGERMSLVAVGGYGRGELAPFSDIDVLFLLPYKQTAWGEQVAEYILYMLWDLGLKVGHATRSVDECVRLSRGDLTIRTALLESRYIWGDQSLFVELQDRFVREVVAGTGPDFVEAKLAERDERHLRFGDSRYLVEPNVKEGKGGLRDLHTLYWIAKYLYRVHDVEALIEQGVFSRSEARSFAKAENFLRTVRCHLHVLANRGEDRLTFDVQPELARRLGYTDRAGASGIERFMKHYYLVAKDVGDLTRIFCAALEEQHRRRPRFRLPRLGLRRRIVDGFPVEGDRITIASPEAFQEDPVRLVRLFHVAQARGLDIHPDALRQITRDLRLIDGKLRRNPEANRLFLEILTSTHDPETALRRMNEAGVFGRFVPDFGRVVAQTQHDMYHVYTVDEHTIRAIGILARIESGDYAADHPLSAEIVHKVLSRRVLYLAVLLHDIAKGRGGDHSVLGEQVALKLGRRLALEPGEIETVAWLVRWHLAMSSTAFKRDLGDPKTIQDFVGLVQSPERLRLLLVLTVADIRAVGPNIWNGWKGQLLRDLYYRAEQAMLGGHAGRRQHAEAALREALAKRLADWPAAELERHFARAPDSFWLSADAATHERWARLMRKGDAEEPPLLVEARADDFRAATELTVYAPDHPGLFSRLAGAVSLAGGSIVDARIFTTLDGMALDVFSVQDSDGRAFRDAGRPDRLARTIEQVLRGEVKLKDELAKRKSRLPSRTHVFKVAPVVLIDNAASNTHTVIEVNGRDRPGLLHDVTRVLFAQSLTISHASVATYGERAVDVFYVKDLFGLKVNHPGKLKSLREKLIDVLQAPDDPRGRAGGPRRSRKPGAAAAIAAE